MAYYVRSQGYIRRSAAMPTVGGRISGGALSGFIAGCAMLAFAMLSGAILGDGPLAFLRSVSCAVYGVDGLVAGGGALMAGLLIHLTVSCCWGMLFSSILPEESTSWTALWTGALYGIGVWAVMTFGVLPWADGVMRARMDLLPDWWFYQHLVYGACLLGTPFLRRRTAASVGVGSVRRAIPRTRIPV